MEAVPNDKIIDMHPDTVQPQDAPTSDKIFDYNTGFSARRPIQSSNFKENSRGFQFDINGDVQINGNRLVSTNFTPVLKAKGLTIYVSDGTTPNGALSGNAGDICFGADSGKAYKCTSTTTWVSFT